MISWDRRAYAHYCRTCSREALRLLHPELPPGDYLDLLRAQGLHVDAVRALGHSLPARIAVWWGSLCLWDLSRGELPASDAEALRAALRWVADASETSRRACEERAQLETPAGCLAFAAFWSGGSVGAPELPAVAPPPQVSGATVGSGILLMAAEYAPLRFHDCCRRLLAIGLRVADGKHSWHATAGAPSLAEAIAAVPAPEHASST